jgi:hypothetical protein
MSAKPDEFEATRQVVATLEPFDVAERERILRWARDKLGMPTPTQSVATTTRVLHESEFTPTTERPMDIRSFIHLKNPRTDTQLAAVVAYFHRFVAPESERKESIGKEDVLSACRLADKSRPQHPQQTMVNAFTAGYFDRAERGRYKLNSVGENLVAVALPGPPSTEVASPLARPKRPAGRNRKRKHRKSASRRSRASQA